MKIRIMLAALGLTVASSVSMASMEYRLDNVSPLTEPPVANQEIVGDRPGDQAFMNIFWTDPGASIITDLKVVWAGLSAGSTVRMALYSVDDSAANPLPDGVVPTFFHLLQAVTSTVTALQRNDDSTVSSITNPVWTTYSITPTHIPTTRFAVGAIAYEDNATYGCVWQNSYAPHTNDIFIAVATNLPMSSDLSNLALGGTDTFNLRTFNAGAWDFPYLIRAEAVVPEPMTAFLLVGVGAAAFLRWRRSNR